MQKKESAYDKIISILNVENIEYKIHTHNQLLTVSQAMQTVNFDLNFCLKTLAFKYKDLYIFVCLHAKDVLDYSKVCNALKINRKDFKKADIIDLEATYGFDIGGISPISLGKNIIVLFSSKIDLESRIYCGSGKSNKTIETKAKNIIFLKNTKVLDITKN